MKITISSVLTNPGTRSKRVVEANLAKELSAGIPWWNVAE